MRKLNMIYGARDITITVIFFILIFQLKEQGFVTGQEGWYLILSILTFITFYPTTMGLAKSVIHNTNYALERNNGLKVPFNLFIGFFTMLLGRSNRDSKGSFIKDLASMFYISFGIIIYPIALVLAIINLGSIFTKDEKYKENYEEDEFVQKVDDFTNNDVYSSDKKYAIDDHQFVGGTKKYFHTEEEAIVYALAHNIPKKYIKKA